MARGRRNRPFTRVLVGVAQVGWRWSVSEAKGDRGRSKTINPGVPKGLQQDIECNAAAGMELKVVDRKSIEIERVIVVYVELFWAWGNGDEWSLGSNCKREAINCTHNFLVASSVRMW